MCAGAGFSRSTWLRADVWGAGVGVRRAEMGLKEALVVPVISLSLPPWPLHFRVLFTAVEGAGALYLPLF